MFHVSTDYINEASIYGRRLVLDVCTQFQGVQIYSRIIVGIGRFEVRDESGEYLDCKAFLETNSCKYELSFQDALELSVLYRENEEEYSSRIISMVCDTCISKHYCDGGATGCDITNIGEPISEGCSNYILFGLDRIVEIREDQGINDGVNYPTDATANENKYNHDWVQDEAKRRFEDVL